MTATLEKNFERFRTRRLSTLLAFAKRLFGRISLIGAAVLKLKYPPAAGLNCWSSALEQDR